MPQGSNKRNSKTKALQLQWKPGTIFSAVLALLAVQLLRAGQHPWIVAIWIETAIFTLIPILGWLLVRRWQQMNPAGLGHQRIMFLAQGLVCVSVLTMITWQYVSRSIGLGDANEFIALVVLQVTSFHLAVFGSVRGFERASFVLSGVLVFFVACTTNRYDVLAVSACYAVSALWWMAGLYWSRLDSKAIDGDSKKLAIHGTATLVSVIVIAIGVGLALLLPLSGGRYPDWGFMPFSGGRDGRQDQFATSGLGDGNMLTAGDNATTTGAVDSDNFIEDDKPSLYDVISEQYNGPIMKKRRNRAVALDKQAKHIHDIKQSEQSGRTFRTMRKTDRETEMDLEERLTKALFFVEGTVPARFIVDTFQHFDGWDWTKASVDGFLPLKAQINLQQSDDKPIFFLTQFRPDYLARLIEFDGPRIPTHTVIDVQGFVPNYHVMRSQPSFHQCANVSQFQHSIDYWLGAAGVGGDPSFSTVKHQTRPEISEPDSPYHQLPETSSRTRIDELAKEYTAGLPAGWNQVEAITNRMRADFELNPQWTIDDSVDDSVGHFLDQKGGPAWMFATTCAMTLRAAGYRTRIASGFLVQREDFDLQSGQSVVTSKNLHMWPEVCMDGKFWIPLEPTPGFPIPYSNETSLQWLMAKGYALIGWFWARPILSLLIFATCYLSYRSRIWIATSLMLAWWHFVCRFWPRNLLDTTRQVIDMRFRLAGDRRPDSRTLKEWYTRVEPGQNSIFFDLWNRTKYCSSNQEIANSELVSRCREPITSLSLKKIQQFVFERKEQGIQ